ncbi:UDP-N-acetylmuramoyl-L-alanyl-D-glutamate--2,6-diaminopimelate ligase [Nocardioides mesophilus]|uniref:UDP-N-acetylmuramoyl-L-alanyl-D-glutamate--2,6-diaminopimelate ligase n=1 Tax=Nocardioides mesophilus TaxID=433659 RepID=A0A7G9RBX0_9ACTN|nr:UDP-N-acetylmuramoyl-L-alanyl-D-glutamate--2,6-diaminopimelate ligase [Nocardioides mesophilus]QNN53095.1 UDP-N-acetylmuramoyl-L-alanyl-D-glutamate--2,6-diaminopimelate ligase [Nocardioides mesophilus]
MPEPIPTRPRHPVATPLRTVCGWLGEDLAEVVAADTETKVRGLTISSQRVLPGDLYVAPAGARSHGAQYAAQAVAAGAVAVLTDPDGAELCRGLPVPVLVVRQPRAVVGALAAKIYGDPAHRLRLVAVTGTQGKTTTTRLAEGALTAAGTRTAVIGTVGTRINGVDVASSLTTPEAPDLHALFAVMVEEQVQACAMEVSSHALVMGRVDGVVFDVACFTNLGRDHLDFHADEEEYYAAKASLFTPARARLGLVNIDDEHGRRLVAEAPIPVRTYSVTGSEADWWAEDVDVRPEGSTFTVHTPGGMAFPASVPLTGGYNVSNALCAIAALAEAGYDPRQVAAGMTASGGVPGRLERVDAGQGFLAVVDYAHKPDAVQAALAALRPQTAGRLLVVLGAGGERDTGKRPLMGETAARLADVLVVTDDNPRGEEPAGIRAAVLAGVARIPDAERAEVHEVGDRREAIRLAVRMARDGDVLVVAGKGHETGQEVRGTVRPFDDRAVLREELDAR